MASSLFRSTLTAAASLLLLLSSPPLSLSPPLGGVQAAPTPGFSFIANPDARHIVPDSYIIKYKRGLAHEVVQQSRRTAAGLVGLDPDEAVGAAAAPLLSTAAAVAGADPRFLLNFFNISSSFYGVHVRADPHTVRRLAQDPAVEYVLYDTYVTRAGGEAVRQPGAVASLARISQAGPLAGREGDYRYDSSAGEGVTVYVIDSGVYVDHPEFEGRAYHGYNAIDRNVSCYAILDGRRRRTRRPKLTNIMPPLQDDSEDDNGHGTNVAGIVGSATYGVAKKAEIVAVKVLDKESWGTWSGIIDGMQWAADDAKYRRRNVGRAVINMSIQSDRVDAMNDMLDAIHDDGIPVVVCAGNYNVGHQSPLAWYMCA